MAQVQTKENMTIAIREYTDNQGQQKKVWKTIGELITWDDGSKSFEVWGPTGSTKGNVFAKDDNNSQQPAQQSNQAPQKQGQNNNGFGGQHQQYNNQGQQNQQPQQYPNDNKPAF